MVAGGWTDGRAGGQPHGRRVEWADGPAAVAVAVKFASPPWSAPLIGNLLPYGSYIPDCALGQNTIRIQLRLYVCLAVFSWRSKRQVDSVGSFMMTCIAIIALFHYVALV